MTTTIDYSQKANLCNFPEITKDIDTFYIFATEFILGSFEEGAPDYGSLDNEEMIQGMGVEYIGHATTYADSTNVFAPYYRQSGLKYAGEVYQRDGNIDAALLGTPYDDIVAALDYYFEHYNDGRPHHRGHTKRPAFTPKILFSTLNFALRTENYALFFSKNEQPKIESKKKIIRTMQHNENCADIFYEVHTPGCFRWVFGTM